MEADAEPGEAPASEVLDAVLDAVVRAQAIWGNLVRFGAIQDATVQTYQIPMVK